MTVALVAGACSGDDSGDDSKAATTEGATTNDAKSNGEGLTVEVVSTRPEYVTGGDVLLAVTLPDGADAADVTISVDGEPADTTTAVGDDGRLFGLVEGLPEGVAEVVVELGGARATVEVANNPTTGPLFSGPHLPLPVCTTEAYGLGAPTDDDCSAPAVVRWTYRSTDGSFKPLDDPAARPADLAEASPGVPFIVREEQGVLNRGIYWVRVLEPDPAGADTFDAGGWNDRLVYMFGGGCGVSYTQGFTMLSDPDEQLLAEGYAFATSTFNTFQVTCNDVLSAETALMVKEHFVESYGLPAHTIGLGGSGGAIQQYLIAQNYPGIIDAVGASVPFPDAVSISGGVVDCSLLNTYYRTPDGAVLTDEQRAAVNGHLTSRTCDMWEQTFARNVSPSGGCSLAMFEAGGDLIKGLPESGVVGLSPDMVYDAETNPDGLRCTLQDGGVNILGRDPDTGFGRRPLDNTGVQYGLVALNEAVIDVEQFLDLNEAIGAYDIDGNPTAARMVAGEEVVGAAYETGRVISGGGPLRDLPVISVNVWTDEMGDIHDRFRAFSLRDRLGADAPGHMIWTRGLPEGDSLVDAMTGTVDLDVEVVHVLDEWLAALADDTTGDVGDRLERTRPGDAVDNCITPEGERVSGLDIYEKPGPCNDPYPLSGDPRTESGAPRRNDVIACALQPVGGAIEAGVYEVDLDDEQVSRLESIFPDGVCDWSVEGRGQMPLGEPWQAFGD